MSAIFPPNLGAAPKAHATRLKDDILAEIPDLQYHRKGKYGYFVFNSKKTELIHEDFLSRREEIEAKTLSDALRILRKDMFSDENRFDGSLLDPNAQTTSVPSQLLSFIRRLLGGASKENGDESIPQSILSVTQLIYSNSVKRRRKESPSNPRQQRSRDTPIPIYVGLMVHNATGSADLVDALVQLGLSISYDRVQEVRKRLGNQICESFLRCGVVFPAPISDYLS